MSWLLLCMQVSFMSGAENVKKEGNNKGRKRLLCFKWRSKSMRFKITVGRNVMDTGYGVRTLTNLFIPE